MANVRCRICRRNKDDDRLLLCDGCNSGFHLYCLRPPLYAIPRGDWFCASCKPPTRPAAGNAVSAANGDTNNRRQRRHADSEAEEGEDDAEESGVSDREASQSSSTEEEDEEEGGEIRRRLRSLRSSKNVKGASKKKPRTARSTSPQSKRPGER